MVLKFALCHLENISILITIFNVEIAYFIFKVLTLCSVFKSVINGAFGTLPNRVLDFSLVRVCLSNCSNCTNILSFGLLTRGALLQGHIEVSL
jgi:hypothetical protein